MRCPRQAANADAPKKMPHGLAYNSQMTQDVLWSILVWNPIRAAARLA
jgi:hypothetical protein